jgi:hypothetical protein
MSAEKNIRLWIGDVSSYNRSTQSSFSNNTTMEESQFASRFRVYVANRKGVRVSGTSSRKFRVNMLVKNTYTSGGLTATYGSVSMGSGTYLLGSLLAWQVTTNSGAVIEKQASEGTGPSGPAQDTLAYNVTNWKELP